MRLRLPRRRVWRALIYIVCLILVLIAIDLLLIQSRRKIHSGYFTTRITSPLRDDGRVDYLTAIETYFGQDVTPQNNAAPLILRAFGRAALPKNQPEDGITDRLGMPHLPQDGDYLIAFDAWCKNHSAAQEDDPVDPKADIAWPVKISSSTEQWLKDNDKPLSLLAEASKKSRYFVPLNGGVRTWSVLEVMIPHVLLLHQSHRPLLTRALLRLQKDDVAGFREDLLTTHRLARLAAQSATLVERIVAIEALEIPACRVARAAAVSGKLSSAQMKSLTSEIASLGDLPPITDAINISERYMGLDVMQSLARLSPYQAADMLNKIVDSGPRIQPIFMCLVPIAYEDSMRGVNHFHDGAMAAAGLATYSQRIAGLKLCEDSLAPATQRNEFSKRYPGDWPAAYLLPALIRAHQQAAIAKMEFRLAQLALALAAFKADHQQYPATLAELSPAYLSTVPDDVFSAKPLNYSPSGEGYKLYSVGPNMNDDGGKSSKPGDDITIILP